MPVDSEMKSAILSSLVKVRKDHVSAEKGSFFIPEIILEETYSIQLERLKELTGRGAGTGRGLL